MGLLAPGNVLFLLLLLIVHGAKVMNMTSMYDVQPVVTAPFSIALNCGAGREHDVPCLLFMVFVFVF